MLRETRALACSRAALRIAVRSGSVVVVIGGITAGSALAAGPGLPRTYDAARYDSPSPGATAQYPLGLSNAGDLNGDGKEDFITSQIVNTRNDEGVISAAGNGAIYVISGATGERIKTIESPDPGGPGTGNTRANFAFPAFTKVGTSRKAPAPFTDLGSCASSPPNAGELCRSATVGPPDGVPDIVVGARGVDARGLKDSGRVYVFDGATFALLKRIDQPQSDTTDVAISRPGGSWFGRRMLNPAGSPPCEGNAGVGSCETLQRSVDIGDVDGGGLPDLVVSASLTSENAASAHPGSHCARTPRATCGAAGRVYVFRGEDIVGSSPAEHLDGTVPEGGSAESVTTVRNIHAQADGTTSTNADSELFGNSLIPIGDVGACRATATVPLPPAGELCPRNNGFATPDGRPDFVIAALRTDLPVDAPDPSLADAGTAYLVDGATSTILAVYRHPEPQLGGIFGVTDVGYPAGDLGDIGSPDVFIGAPGQTLPRFSAAGRGYVMNGNFKTGTSSFNFARLDDPTPVTSGNFGAAWTGVGDLVPGSDNPANELLVGSSAGFFGSGPKSGIFSDVHFFNASTERVLQTIPDPDNQAASQFGNNVIPMGDLNNDTFLDFAVAAPLYDGPTLTDEGRVYVFRSNNTPLPPRPSPSAETRPPANAGAPPSAAATPAATGTSPAEELRSGRCANVQRGTGNKDRLLGTKAGDTVFSLGGDDVVRALSGHDCVDAGSDDDDAAGGSGEDSVLGGSGDDKLDGGTGDDRLFGESGDDVLNGLSGKDMLAGGSGKDRLNGGSGADRLFGERGNDRLVAGDSGGSRLDGGVGNDRLDAVNGRRDTVRCGSGFDRAVVDKRLDRVSRCERVTRRKRA